MSLISMGVAIGMANSVLSGSKQHNTKARLLVFKATAHFDKDAGIQKLANVPEF